jgi:uncharacterized SAM-binding protein YcdF (DUF218 family)
MFFILSKVLLFLLQPICWIFFLLIFSAITKNIKRKKRLFFIALGLLWFFSNPFFLNQFARLWDIPPQNTPSGTYSCAIVLGGFSSFDKDGNGYFNAASDRFIQAVKLKTTGKVSKILISGANGSLLNGKDFKEADYVSAQLKELKFADSTILIENQSRNTIENALFSKRILMEKKVQPPYLLITSAFHMRRALYTFKKAGVDVVPYPCDYFAGRGSSSVTDFIIPDAAILAEWNTYLKEAVGLIAYRFKPFH